MNNNGRQILLWFGRMALWLGMLVLLGTACTLIWWFASGGSQSTVSLKWGQLVQTAGVFLLPPLICAVIFDSNYNPFRWLHLNRGADGLSVLLAIAIMLCALPGINLLADLNGRLVLPDCLSGVEQWMKQYEQAAEQLMERFLQANNLWGLLLNLGLIALLPALGEELTFRGTLQQLLGGKPGEQGLTWKTHLAIWITAFLFSAIHMQFYGFVPRMLMGAMFGYVFVWTGSLWLPVLMHFTNNAMVVIVNYCFDQIAPECKNYADTLGAGTTWWLGLLSLVLTSLGLLIFYRRTRTR